MAAPSARPDLSLVVRARDACPYFTWDAPVTNAAIRRALTEGSPEERLHWMARILREARYEDVWAYVSLRRDVLPNWEPLRARLGRRRDVGVPRGHLAP